MKNTILFAVLIGLCGCATTSNPVATSPKQPVAIRRSVPPPDALAVTSGYSLSPTGATSPATGGSGQVSLTTPIWTAVSSDPSWLTVSPSSGSGNATLSWSATANAGTSRAATLTIADQSFIVSQAGAVVPPSTNTWLKGFGAQSSDAGKSVIIDAAGNVFVTGTFYGSVSFGGDQLVSAGSTDIFVAKYTSAGNFLWSKRFGGPGGESVSTIALDSSGNILLGGDFITGSVLKLTPSGDFVWISGPVTSNGFNFGATCYDIAVDSLGNIIATGGFQSPFTGSQPLDFGSGLTLNSYVGSVDVFLAKYAPGGNCLWVKGFAAGDVQYGTGVVVDHDNILLTGYAFGSVNFGGLTLTNTSPGAFGFLAKFQPSGAHVWSRRVGIRLEGDTSAPYARARKLAVAANGDIAVSGEFRIHSNFAGDIVDGGANGIINSTATSYDIFLARYSGGDSHYLWAVPINGNLLATPQRLLFDSTGNVNLAGYFQGTIHLGAILSLTTAGFQNTSDGFVAKYSPAGAPLSAQRFGGTLDGDNAFSFSLDALNRMVVTGTFQGTAGFGTGTLTSAGQQDIFVWKMP